MQSDSTKKMNLGVFLAGTGHHVASWRHPRAKKDASMNFNYFKELAQTAEKGKFDLLFLADSLSINPKSHPNVMTRFEPFTILGALAQATTKIGLVATASTTYSEPFHIARQFASLDHLSEGRAGWNVVTSSIPDTAKNFSGTEHLEHSLRYDRADEFVDVVQGLWDSWEEEAFIRNQEAGVFFDPAKYHELNHTGNHFQVRGPLNVERTPQGQPVIVQAGSSKDGMALAAKYAEIIFTAQNNKEAAQTFYADIKKQVQENGRNSDDVKVLPGIFPIIGATVEEANQKYQELQDLIQPEVGLSILSTALGGFDLSDYPLDGPLPEINVEHSNAVKSRAQLIIDMAKRDELTIRQLYQYVAGSRGHHIFVGTPSQLADKLEEWFKDEACDGFNVMPPLLPEGLDQFVQDVVPILQERGLFRHEYDAPTLRGNLGIEEPLNRYTNGSNHDS